MEDEENSMEEWICGIKVTDRRIRQVLYRDNNDVCLLRIRLIRSHADMYDKLLLGTPPVGSFC